MKADFILGVCFDIDDPNNLGRIRAIPIGEIGVNSSLRDIRSYVKLQDNSAISSFKYQPWYITKFQNFKEKDPYVFEPFLPKNMGVIPNPGQLIKIIKYDNDVSQEYLGPFTIDQVTLTEEYRNVIRNLQKNMDISTVLPKKGKTSFAGYNSEQLIMGENEIIMRLAHINTDKTRRNTYPFTQLTQFGDSYNIVNQKVSTTSTIDPAINFIAELYIDYVPKISSVNEQNISGSLILYDASTLLNTQNKLGLTKNTYVTTKSYINKFTDSFIVKHDISTSNVVDFGIIVNAILQNYNSASKISYYAASGATTQIKSDATKNQTIVVKNNLPLTPTAGGGTHDDPTVITGGLRNWLFRLAPSTTIKNYIGTFTAPNIKDPLNINVINYNDFITLDAFITKFAKQLNYGKLADNSKTVITSDQDVPVKTGTPQSVQTTYSDKFLFLSSITSPSLVDDMSKDGFSASKIAEILYGSNQNIKTYGFIRGEALMDLLNDFMTIILTHGHAEGVDPRASLIESSKQLILDIQKRIQDEKKQNQNNVVINHNLRLN